jgi:hypothetical protein
LGFLFFGVVFVLLGGGGFVAVVKSVTLSAGVPSQVTGFGVLGVVRVCVGSGGPDVWFDTSRLGSAVTVGGDGMLLVSPAEAVFVGLGAPLWFVSSGAAVVNIAQISDDSDDSFVF